MLVSPPEPGEFVKLGQELRLDLNESFAFIKRQNHSSRLQASYNLSLLGMVESLSEEEAEEDDGVQLEGRTSWEYGDPAGLDDFKSPVSGRAQTKRALMSETSNPSNFVKIINKREKPVHIKALPLETESVSDWQSALGGPISPLATDLESSETYEMHAHQPKIQRGLIRQSGSFSDQGTRLDSALVSMEDFPYCLVQLNEDSADGELLGVVNLRAGSKLTTFTGIAAAGTNMKAAFDAYQRTRGFKGGQNLLQAIYLNRAECELNCGAKDRGNDPGPSKAGSTSAGQKRARSHFEEDAAKPAKHQISAAEQDRIEARAREQSIQAFRASQDRIKELAMSGIQAQHGPFADIPEADIPRGVPGGKLGIHDDGDEDFDNFV